MKFRLQDEAFGEFTGKWPVCILQVIGEEGAVQVLQCFFKSPGFDIAHTAPSSSSTIQPGQSGPRLTTGREDSPSRGPLIGRLGWSKIFSTDQASRTSGKSGSLCLRELEDLRMTSSKFIYTIVAILLKWDLMFLYEGLDAVVLALSIFQLHTSRAHARLCFRRLGS